jgi:hypothetical protein
MDLNFHPSSRSSTRAEEAPPYCPLHDKRTTGRPSQCAQLKLRINGEAVDEVVAYPTDSARHPQGPADNLDTPGQVPFFAGLGEHAGQENRVESGLFIDQSWIG